MTLPRELKLEKREKGYILTSVPVVETELLRTEQVRLEPGPLNERDNVGPTDMDSQPLYEIDLVFEFDPDVVEEVEFGIVLESNRQEKLVAGYNVRTQQVFVARDQSGIIDFSDHFPGDHTAPFQPSEEGEIRFHAFVDLSSMELFVDQGALTMTELCFPESGYEKIHLFSNHESVSLKEGNIYGLKSTW